MIEQTIVYVENDFIEFDQYIHKIEAKSILLVCGRSIELLKINHYFIELKQRGKVRLIRFSNFSSNPSYESVVEGVTVFRQENCDTIIAVGGGSAIDVAKCIKLFASMNENGSYLKQRIVPNKIPLLAVPTTSGTGSEATQFAVIYEQGEKHSISDQSCIPNFICMDASVLETLPLYQKKATMLDAFCHALESYWSIYSTNKSKSYAKKAIGLIRMNYKGYLKNRKSENRQMMWAANLAGRAINLTRTTAGHAMCYKLTMLYGIAHGHAAGLCVSQLWDYMIRHMDDCVDKRGKRYLEKMFIELANIMGSKTAEEAVEVYRQILDFLELQKPVMYGKQDIEILCDSVNVERLKNNPILLRREDISLLYRKILV